MKIITFNLISCLVQNIYVKGGKILRASLLPRYVPIKLNSSCIRIRDTYPKTSEIVQNFLIPNFSPVTAFITYTQIKQTASKTGIKTGKLVLINVFWGTCLRQVFSKSNI